MTRQVHTTNLGAMPVDHPENPDEHEETFEEFLDRIEQIERDTSRRLTPQEMEIRRLAIMGQVKIENFLEEQA